MFELGLTLLLTILCIGGCIGNVLGLPGNWLIVTLSAACFWFRPESQANHVALSALVSILIVAIVGELLEFAASALGASRVGASKRATALSMVGSIGGAIVGLFAGTLIPIPIVGNLIASLMLGGVGAFAGAVAGERWVGKQWEESFEVGSAAFWGHLLGTVGKAVCGTVACGLFLVAIWW